MINLTNSKVQEYRSAALVAGLMVANSFLLKRVDDGLGNSAVAIATGAVGEDLVGIANVSPISSIARSVIGEEKTGVGGVVTLNWPIEGAEPSVYNVTADSAVDPADVAVSGSNQITITTTVPADTDVLSINYNRSVTLAELSLEGLPLDYANKVNGSDGAVEFATGKSTLEVDFFAADVPYVIGDPLYSDANGIISSVPVDAASPVAGTCSIVPTAENPVLGISIDLKF